MADNIERLRDAGFTIKTPMPEEYEAVLQELGDDEVETLISVKQRLDVAQVSLRAETLDYVTYLKKQDYVNYFVPF